MSHDGEISYSRYWYRGHGLGAPFWSHIAIVSVIHCLTKLAIIPCSPSTDTVTDTTCCKTSQHCRFRRARTEARFPRLLWRLRTVRRRRPEVSKTIHFVYCMGGMASSQKATGLAALIQVTCLTSVSMCFVMICITCCPCGLQGTEDMMSKKMHGTCPNKVLSTKGILSFLHRACREPTKSSPGTNCCSVYQQNE